jgi:hypothetical protein
MMSVPKASRRSRWAVPAALVATVVVTAVTVATAAAASPSLPPRTPAQLLTDLATEASSPTPMSGQLVVSADLGIPQLPGQDSPSSILSLLTGSHTISLAYADRAHFRLALPVPLGETDVIRDGSTAWIWQSGSDSVTQLTLPANGAGMDGNAGQAPSGPAGSPSPGPVTPLTPQQAVQQLLTAIGPSTSLTTGDTTTVAGEDAYQLVVTPRESGSLIGSVVIALDAGHPGVVLSVQVFPRGAQNAAWSEQFQSVTFATPDASTFLFTPPQGATVHTVTPPATPSQPASPQPQQPATAGAQVIGKDWLSVLELPSSALAGLTSGGNVAGAVGQAAQSAAAGPGSGPGGGITGADIWSALLKSATTVHGSFGSGQLIRTSLLSVLITGGHVFVGAVDPSVLYSAAAQAG